MKLTHKLIVAIGCLVLAGGALEVASADPGNDGAKRPPANAKVSLLKAKFKPTRAERKRLRTIGRLVKRSPRGSLVARARVANARPVRRAVGLGDAWIAPAADGSICTFIPDPLGGYASSCATQDDLRAGGSITAVGAGPGRNADAEAHVVVVIPDGAPNPTAVSPDGEQSEIPIDANAGAATVGLGTTIRAGGKRLTIPRSIEPVCEPVEQGATSQVCRF